jgi:hypothetical protein
MLVIYVCIQHFLLYNMHSKKSKHFYTEFIMKFIMYKLRNVYYINIDMNIEFIGDVIFIIFFFLIFFFI